MTISPTACPKSSLTRLKSSISSIKKAKRRSSVLHAARISLDAVPWLPCCTGRSAGPAGLKRRAAFPPFSSSMFWRKENPYGFVFIPEKCGADAQPVIRLAVISGKHDFADLAIRAVGVGRKHCLDKKASRYRCRCSAFGLLFQPHDAKSGRKYRPAIPGFRK